MEGAIASGEVKRESIADKVKNLLSKDTASAETSSSTLGSTDSSDADVVTTPEVLAQVLTTEIDYLSVTPLSQQDILVSQTR